MARVWIQGDTIIREMTLDPNAGWLDRERGIYNKSEFDDLDTLYAESKKPSVDNVAIVAVRQPRDTVTIPGNNGHDHVLVGDYVARAPGWGSDLRVWRVKVGEGTAVWTHAEHAHIQIMPGYYEIYQNRGSSGFGWNRRRGGGD